MTEIINPTRAQVGYIETLRENKNPNGKPTKVRAHSVISEGMYSSKELEKTMIQVAKDVGADESQIRIVPYQNGEAPITANPRHRGSQPSFRKEVSEPTAYKPREFQRVRNVFAGIDLPKTPEEVAAVEAEFKARWQ